MRLILGIDQGTTSTTSIIIDESLKIKGKASIELKQHYPQHGWVEHEPEEIMQTVRIAVENVIKSAGISARQIEAIGITNQRETTILWDRESGRPLHPAIVWQCRRTTPICRKMQAEGLEEIYRSRTGLILDPYFSGTKIRWLLENFEDINLKAQAGLVAFGTVDCFLLNKFTGGKVHATDPSNASRTLLFNIHKMNWDEELCKLMGIPVSILPEVKPNFCVFGTTKGLDFLPDGIPIAAMAGDQQAALFGQACFKKDEAKCTFGTGAFMLLNTGNRAVISKNGLLASIGWQRGKETVYVLEGSSFTAGSAVQWLRDGTSIIRSASEIEALALKADPLSELLFIPAFTGLGAPFWVPEVRGALLGMTRQTGKSEIARAILEGIAMQIVELARAMESDTGSKIVSIKVDGGASENNLLMQLQADLLGIEIIRPEVLETTVAGVSMMAGITAGILKGEEEIISAWRYNRSFKPSICENERERRIKRWERGVEAVKYFAGV